MGKREMGKDSMLYLDAKEILQGVSVDCVIFGFHNGKMKILLNRFESHNQFMLPGGFIYYDENVEDAAHRILKNRTGLDRIYLQQFYLFGDRNRTSIKENEGLLHEENIPLEQENKKHWLLQRFVSVGYYAFVDYEKVNVYAPEKEFIDWFDVESIPELYSDHNRIIEKAISVIRSQLRDLPIGYELLPEKFTISDLRIIYETILGKEIDRRNFQRNILSKGFIIKLEEVSKRWGVKTTSLYSFDKEKYEEARVNGFSFF